MIRLGIDMTETMWIRTAVYDMVRRGKDEELTDETRLS